MYKKLMLSVFFVVLVSASISAALLDPVTNFAKGIVSTTYDASATSIVLSTGDGANFPSTFSYNIIWWNATDFPDPSDDPNREIVRVTNRVTDTLTVTRAQEGTSATTKNTSGKTYLMVLGITKKVIDDIDLFFIGADSTQTITNKTIDTANNTITVVEADVLDLAHTPEGTAVLSTGEAGGTKFLREDGDNSSSWQTVTAPAIEGTAVLSTGEVGGTKFLREDGDGTCSWQAAAGGGTMSDLIDDVTPQLGGFLDTNSFAINESEGANVASATTTDIYGGDDGNTLHITGTTTIVDFTDASSVGQWRRIIFDGILLLTHGSGITLPASANITTAVGDYAFVYADTVSAFTVLYFKADGTPLVSGDSVGTIPAFSVHKNGTSQIDIVTSTVTKLTWSTEIFDTNSDFASDRFTPTVAGKYLIHGQANIISLADGAFFEIILRKNGSDLAFHRIVPGAAVTLSAYVSMLVEANGTTDFFELFVQHQHGSNRNIDGASSNTYFQGFKIVE